ncbi:transposable element Tc1 transposase [Trichonephila clavipes]|nr:transposable element Tc1 transposase [Trichonephila clavipes]
MVLSNEFRFHLCPDDNRRRVWRRPGQRANPVFTISRLTGLQQGVMYPSLIFQQDNAKPHTTYVALNCLKAYQTLPWPARSHSNRACLGYDGKAIASPGNVDDLAQQLKQIWQEIPQETIRVFYHSMSRRVTACIQARSGSTPY